MSTFVLATSESDSFTFDARLIHKFQRFSNSLEATSVLIFCLSIS